MFVYSFNMLQIYIIFHTMISFLSFFYVFFVNWACLVWLPYSLLFDFDIDAIEGGTRTKAA